MASLVFRNVNRILPRINRLAILESRRGKLGAPLTSIQSSPSVFSSLSSARHLSAQAELLAEDEVKLPERSQSELSAVLANLEESSRRQRRVLSKDISRALTITERSQVCPPGQALLLIKCCGDVLVDFDRERRSKLVQRCFSLLQSIPGLNLDISHYNALLKVHQENHNNINVPEFMAALEADNIKPNRVTFQHIVALYCQAGDMAGATTILQHMKENDLAINESVLLSLLSAHCANNDSDSVTSTLSTMSNADINIGVDVFTTMAVSYARSGNWEKVQETLEKANSEKVRFDDSNIFTIMKACVDGKLDKETFSLIEKMPRNRGFFQELRNSIPHLAQSGNISLLMELAYKKEDRAGFDKSNHGAYLVSSITNSGAPVEEVLAAVLKLEESGYTLALQQMLQEASYSWSHDKCTALKEELTKAIGDREPEMHVGKSNSFLRDVFGNDNDTDKILACLVNFKLCGVPVPQDFVALELLPAMLDVNLTRPRDVAQKVKDVCPKVAFSPLANSILQHLLNQRSSECFNLAAEFFLYNNIVYSKANSWNASLSRAYLCTKDVDNMTTMLFLGQRKKLLMEKDPLIALNYLFKSLAFVQKQAKIFQPSVSSDELLTPIIEDLIQHKIGIPKDVACYNGIYENIQSRDVKDLLVKATKVWEDGEAYWTEDRTASFIASRKKILREQMRGAPAEDNNGLNEESVESMQRMHNRLLKKGIFNFKLVDQLIVKYLEAQDLDKAKQVLNDSKSSGKSFSLAHKTLELFVTTLVKENMSDEAGRLILQEMENGNEKKNRINGAIIKICLAGLAEQGDHKAVMDLLEKVDKSLIYDKDSYNNKLLDVYVKRGEDAKLHEVFDYLVSNGLASTDKNDNLNALIDIHLERDNLTAATEEFLRIANVYKKLPRKFVLTCKLIEVENVEAIQNITDVSTKIVRESRILYDLAHCFLSMKQKYKARQLFDSPGLAYDQERTEYIYNKLEKQDVTLCEDLVAVTRNIFGSDRNHLYSKLVNTHRNNPHKVDDIWLLIQEEGLVPSDELKRQIANVLSLHNKTIPFEKPDEISTDEEGKISDGKVFHAIKNRQTKLALKITMDSFEEKDIKTSLTCRKSVVEHLIKQNDFDGASKLAAKIANSSDDPFKIHFFRQFYKIRENLGDQKGEQFFNSLPSRFAEHLRTNYRGGENRTEFNIDISKQREVLNNLIKDSKFEEASKLLVEMCENDNSKQLAAVLRQASLLINRLQKDSKLVDEMKKMFDSLGPECCRLLKADYRYKIALIRTNPEKYIETFKEKEDLKFLVSTEVLKGAIGENPELVSQLETLATSGNVLALITMMRLSLENMDKEKFLKYYKSCSRDVDGSYIFEKIDTEEKFNVCLNEAVGNKGHLNALINRSLYSNHDDIEKFVNIANVGVEKGMDVTDISKSFLKKLSSREDFKLQKEAAALLQN